MSSLTRYATVAALVLFSGSAAQAAECDRDCLRGMITKYVEAIVAHAPQSLPLAENVRFTEDSRELKLGDGAWKTVTRAGSFRQDYLDVRRGIAASHVELYEEAGQLQYSVVLRIVDQKITGVETLLNRITPTSKFQPDSLGKPLRKMNDPVPRDTRMQRADLRPADRELCGCHTVCEGRLPRRERRVHRRRRVPTGQLRGTLHAARDPSPERHRQRGGRR